MQRKWRAFIKGGDKGRGLVLRRYPDSRYQRVIDTSYSEWYFEFHDRLSPVEKKWQSWYNRSSQLEWMVAPT